MQEDPRRLIVRLAVAVMTADGRITQSERDALQRFDRLGLGPLSQLVDEEAERAVHAPIDVRDTCEGLTGVGPQGAAVILSALAEVAVSDRELSSREIETLKSVATMLGLTERQFVDVVNLAVRPADGGGVPFHRDGAPGWQVDPSRGVVPPRADTSAQQSPTSAQMRTAGAAATSPPLTPEVAQAYRRLGLDPGAPLAHVDAAYLVLVDRYNPAKVVDLGTDFAALAARKLADATAAFETVRAALTSQGQRA